MLLKAFEFQTIDYRPTLLLHSRYIRSRISSNETFIRRPHWRLRIEDKNSAKQNETDKKLSD